MKNFLVIIMALLMLVLACVSLPSCSSGDKPDKDEETKETNETNTTVTNIDFGKKYMLSEDKYYVFNDDKTGYYECYDEKDEYTLSGRVDFEWREANNGAVYLFEVDVEYNKDHTKGKKISIIDEPIYFSDEFFVYSSTSQYTGSSTTRYIKEDSGLEKFLDD